MSIDAVKRKGIAYVGNGVEIKPSLIEGAGNGLFARVAFDINDYITEYDGECIDRSEAMSLPADQTTHFRSIDSDRVISGFKDPNEAIGRGGASFANDTRSQDGNNSMFEQVWDNKLATHRVFLRATSRIEPGDEICVSYGRDYWRKYGV